MVSLLILLASGLGLFVPSFCASSDPPAPCCRPPAIPALPGSPNPLLDFLENTDTDQVDVRISDKYAYQVKMKDFDVTNLFDSQWRSDHGLEEPRLKKQARSSSPSLNQTSVHELGKRRNKLVWPTGPWYWFGWEWLYPPSVSLPPAYPVQPQCWGKDQEVLNGNYGGLRLCYDLLMVVRMVTTSERDWPWDLLCEAMYEGQRTAVYGKAIRGGPAKARNQEVPKGLEWLLHSCPRADNCYTRLCPVGGVNSAWTNGHYTVIVTSQ